MIKNFLIAKYLKINFKTFQNFWIFLKFKDALSIFAEKCFDKFIWPQLAPHQ